jgi:hypothetical protein
METLMSGAMVVEGALLSFLLALWMAWLALSGLFRLMPITCRPISDPKVQPVRFVANRQERNRQRNAA